MLDIGWNELLIVALITILVVGPKELPHVLRTVTQFVRKMRAMASEFQSGLDDLAREAELQELKQSIEKTASTDLAGELEGEIDPTGEINREVRELENQVKEDPRRRHNAGAKGGSDTRRKEPAQSTKASTARADGAEEGGKRKKAEPTEAADTPANAKAAGKGS